jgi:steroid delta-isomerase-like uncharacterized protein
MSDILVAADSGTLDREFAVEWYLKWIRAWNGNDPESVRDFVTEDFILDSPTTRHTGWFVQGWDATSAYISYVLGAYPDLKWEVTAPPMFADEARRAAFSWRGTGHFSGTLTPPGLPGTGKAFDFSGLEVFEFRGDRACRLFASYDLIGLTKQIGIYASARVE